MITGAIFDLDGTILDSMPYWDSVGSDYMASLGFVVPPEVKAQIQAISMSKVAQFLIDYYSLDTTVDQFKADVYLMMQKHYLEDIPIKTGVDDFLCRLKNNGVKMCIATATAKSLADQALRRLGLREYFSEIFSVDEIGAGKGHPDIYRAALNHLGTKKEETFVIEDIWKALETANKDGFVTVGVYDDREKANQDRLKENADYYIEQYSDFDKFWETLNK